MFCQVRLRKVERLWRDGGLSVEGVLRPRHSGMTRTSSHCSLTSSAGSLAYSLEAFETFDSFDLVIHHSLVIIMQSVPKTIVIWRMLLHRYNNTDGARVQIL